MIRRRGVVFLLTFFLATLSAAAATPVAGDDDFAALLTAMRPDSARWVGSVRMGPTRFHPPGLYMGLVRAGGLDPRAKEDTPMVGSGVRNDIIVYADSREAGRSRGWAMLLIDHEYFHARHLGRGDRTPTPFFGNPEVDRHFYEAVAWGYNLAQADEGEYPTLTHADYAEAFRNYTLHFEAFREFILKRDHPAWAHYRRFLPDPAEREEIVLARN